MTLPEVETRPSVLMLPPRTLPDALTTPPSKLEPVMAPVLDIKPPVSKLPPVMLPDELRLINMPTLVMLACALAVTYCAVLAVPAEPAEVA